jgi:GntR family transcriptional regulator
VYGNINTPDVFSRIDPRSPVPLYAQIAERIRIAIAAGELRGGDDLPSVRVLAAKLRVNPATVVQAYRDLEQESLVVMRQGAGTTVADIPAGTRERERLGAARRFVRQKIAEASRLGLAAADIRAALDHEYPESK